MKLKNALVATLMASGRCRAVLTAQAATTLRFASEAPRSDTQFNGAEKFNELLKAKTNGALDIKIYTDSSLGAFQAAIGGVRAGTIDLAISGGNNFTGLVPLLASSTSPTFSKIPPTPIACWTARRGRRCWTSSLSTA